MMLNSLLHTINTFKQRGFKLAALSTDINKANDGVSLEKLKSIMFKAGLPSRIVLWALSYLSKRNLHMKDTKITVTGDIPQGCCLSPTIFNMYTASIHSIEDDNIFLFQYADDFFLLSVGKPFDKARINLQRKTLELVSKCQELNFTVNPSKTKTILFLQGSDDELEININNQHIQQDTTIKILGRDISASLSVTAHYKRITEESLIATKAFKMINTIKGGLHPKFGLNTYRSMLRSKVEFARSTSCGAPLVVEKQIETFQNAHLCRCLGLPTNTPNHILYHMSNELPPKFRALWLTAKEIVSIVIYNNSFFTLFNKK